MYADRYWQIRTRDAEEDIEGDDDDNDDDEDDYIDDDNGDDADDDDNDSTFIFRSSLLNSYKICYI